MAKLGKVWINTYCLSGRGAFTVTGGHQDGHSRACGTSLSCQFLFSRSKSEACITLLHHKSWISVPLAKILPLHWGGTVGGFSLSATAAQTGFFYWFCVATLLLSHIKSLISLKRWAERKKQGQAQMLDRAGILINHIQTPQPLWYWHQKIRVHSQIKTEFLFLPYRQVPKRTLKAP